MSVGERIAKRRKELGLTQQELAAKMGYSSKTTINKIELGINNVSDKKLFAFAEALDVDVAWLLGANEQVFNLTPKRKHLLELVERLSDEQVEAILKLLGK